LQYIKYVFLFVWMPVQIILAVQYTPQVEGLGFSTRVFYFHVPVAWMTVLAFLFSAIYSVQYLRKKEGLYDLKAESSARLGLLFSFLATISGSAWAKVTWGEYWNWDPRQTSILILMIIYLAYFTLRSSIDEFDRKANLSAVYSLAAFATVPLLVFVIPRIYESLHPDPILNERGKVEMSSTIRQLFLVSMIGFTFLFFYIKSINDKLIIYKNRKRETYCFKLSPKEILARTMAEIITKPPTIYLAFTFFLRNCFINRPAQIE